MPGNSWSRWRAITSSSGTNAPPPMGTSRGSTSFGTFTRAKVSVSDTGSRTHTATLSDRFEMYGNGRPGPTASGVSAGKICSRKIRSTRACSSSSQASQETTRRPSSASSGRMRDSHSRDCRAAWADTRSTIRSIVSEGERPSGPRASIPASTWSCRPATRTMKNSSWFDAQMARNLARSSSGICSSSASWSTRSLKSSQESSRLA